MAQGKIVISFRNGISRQGRDQRQRSDHRYLTDILRPTLEGLLVELPIANNTDIDANAADGAAALQLLTSSGQGEPGLRPGRGC